MATKKTATKKTATKKTGPTRMSKLLKKAEQLKTAAPEESGAASVSDEEVVTETPIGEPRDINLCCRNCLFCMAFKANIKTRNGVTEKEQYECHVYRPTQRGFPNVRPNDFCSFHVQAGKMERTFVKLTPNA